ncbi:hypothetical protein GCM10007320_05370 [Pseudorhodoferax aquiterrae]|uniref:DUF3604 domain-containing protein n=1 Tax=Pseudorhodoferax aquiterrae TaxID=747304 RepID=A0ABQ3FVJ1_9BURK|nr:hypothetical protein [Pseudorhodoferax aquiterrae]GHC70699.1 hypothetical protein GCM10007320_05370 [Pseudorhodoferax aquiterrae]
MKNVFKKNPVALAAVTVLATLALAPAAHAAKPAGTYVTGDFHNHTTCSDGAISMQKLVKKSTDKTDTPWGLDWFVQAGHGGTGNRNCTLAEDDSLATPAYPLVYAADGSTVIGPNTTWQNSQPPVEPQGTPSGTRPNQNMWRWQAIQQYQYPITEYLNALKNVPIFVGMESVVSGHEHTSMSVITGQVPAAIDTRALPTTKGYTPLGNANALSQWAYCFDRGNDGDLTRGGPNGWTCNVPGSANEASPNWNAGAAKLMGSGEAGHIKTVEGIKWMAAYHPDGSYYVPAHLERAGPFNPNGNNGFNVEHLRNFNNAGPRIAVGFESQPGHGASDNRGEYSPNRNSIGGVRVDSVGGTTYGGTGVYAAQIGGVWDALLGEGRNWWFFGSSDWHNRGQFGPDDRRSTQDFYPGEYQRDFIMVRKGNDTKLRPQTIVDGIRSGNSFVATGQLIDRLAFVACASYAGPASRTNAAVEAMAVKAALANTDTDVAGCATMGEKLQVRAGAEIVVSIVVRDPAGTNYAPYTFANPSLAQVGIQQPLNRPVLDHVDVVRGLVSGYRQPGSAGYAGQWPNDWLINPNMANVPDAAKNTTAAVLRTFNESSWKPVAGNAEYKVMSFRIPAVTASQYLRLRGSNLPASVPYETDANGNPLADVYTNAGDTTRLTIPCQVAGVNVPGNGGTYTGTAIDGCPNHLPTVAGQKYVAYDVAAWADLWFYSNPIFVEVAGSTVVAGVK